MESFISIIIVLIIVAGLVFWRSRMYKDAFLDKLPLLPGEKILFEGKCKNLEANIRLKQIRTFPNSMARITNLRLILAQKVIGSDRQALRYVFDLDASQEKVLPFIGYTSMKITKNNINFIQNNKEEKIEIVPTVGAGLMVPFSIRITMFDSSVFKKALGL